MTKQLPCPRCGKARDVKTIEGEEKVAIKGRQVLFTAKFSRCMTYGAVFEALGQLDENLTALN